MTTPKIGDRVLFYPGYLRGMVLEVKPQKMRVRFDTELEVWVMKSMISPVPEDVYEQVYRRPSSICRFSYKQLVAFDNSVYSKHEIFGTGKDMYVGALYNLSAIFKSIPFTKAFKFVVKLTKEIIYRKHTDDESYICLFLWNGLQLSAAFDSDKEEVKQQIKLHNKELVELSTKLKVKYKGYQSAIDSSKVIRSFGHDLSLKKLKESERRFKKIFCRPI